MKLYTVRNPNGLSVESSMAYLSPENNKVSPININIQRKNAKSLLNKKPDLTKTLSTFRQNNNTNLKLKI